MQYDAGAGEGILDIACGKGTYVRTILHDIGAALGCGCIMTALTRTMACGFTLADAHSFDAVQQAADSGEADALIIPTDRLFAALPGLTDAARYRLYSPAREFLGLCEADREAGVLRVYKNL